MKPRTLLERHGVLGTSTCCATKPSRLTTSTVPTATARALVVAIARALVVATAIVTVIVIALAIVIVTATVMVTARALVVATAIVTATVMVTTIDGRISVGFSSITIGVLPYSQSYTLLTLLSTLLEPNSDLSFLRCQLT